MRDTHEYSLLLTQPLTVWRAQLRSLSNLSRAESRLRVGLGISLAFSLALGIWSSSQLLGAIHQWQTQGPTAVTNGLWLLCLGIWGGMCSFTILGVPARLTSDEALLLFTLPIAPATRFRAFYGSFFITNLWLWTLLQGMVMGYTLLSTLGWSAFIWLAVLQLGSIVTVGLVLVLTLLVMRYLWPRGQNKPRAIVTTTGGGILLLAIVFHSALVTYSQTLLSWLRPEYALVILVLLLILLVGPGASISGKLYQETMLLMQSQDRARGQGPALSLRGTRQFSNFLSRRRSLTGALFTRSIVNQSRNWFFWGRLVVIWSLLTLFPLLRTSLSHHGFTDTVLIAGSASSLAVGHILETAPGAISGEANRLALYLTAPFDFAHILWAKLAIFLLPTLAEALTMGLLLCWWFGLSLSQVSTVFLLIPLIVLPCTVLLVWGSTWDENLNQSVEGITDSILLEEGPFSPRKLLLFNLCLLCLAAILLLLWRLPVMLAWPGLVVGDAVFVAGMQRLAVGQLRRILQ